uniref:Uncharacterized protein n=1 Tax=Anguilla anguilla TaxID=7936 RepID=A0A0E9WT93_ANGAN
MGEGFNCNVISPGCPLPLHVRLNTLRNSDDIQNPVMVSTPLSTKSNVQMLCFCFFFS